MSGSDLLHGWREADLLATLHHVAFGNGEAPGLHVGDESVLAVRDLDDHMVASGIEALTDCLREPDRGRYRPP